VVESAEEDLSEPSAQVNISQNWYFHFSVYFICFYSNVLCLCSCALAYVNGQKVVELAQKNIVESSAQV
jgi:hypothetical protein